MLEAFRVGIVGRGGTLFDGFDAAFREGEVWALTGSPDSGKSRLLEVLHGTVRPDAGDVMLDAASVYRGEPDAPARLQRVAALVSERLDPPARTVGELFRLASLAADPLPAGEREAREAELLSLAGIAGVSGYDFRSLSNSERFRALLAVELFRGPRLLLLDAPFSRSGKEWMEMLCALLPALAREGRIVVLAERSLPPALPLKPAGEPLRSGPFVLTRLFSVAPDEGGER